MSIGVMYQGEVVLEHNFGFADLEAKVVPDSTTRYPLGSLTKAFVATTVAQLVDENLLKWDEPLNTYIPELSFDSDPYLSTRLTLIDLLSHQTGLSRLDALWLGANGEVNVPKNFTVAMCNHLPYTYPYRSTWLYNNWMYALADEVIERVTGSPFGEVLASRVLEKVGLAQTTIIKDEIPINSTAAPYLILDYKSPSRTAELGLTDGVLMSTAGGIRSTVHDMLKWGHAILSPFRDEKTPLSGLDSILSSHSFLKRFYAFDELYTLGFAKVTTPARFGRMGFNPSLIKEGMPILGTVSDSRQVFYHNGAITGYNNCIMLIPGLDAVIIVLTNSISHGDTADWAAQTILQAVLDTSSPTDLHPLAKKAANMWTTTYKAIRELLEQERIPGTKAPPHDELVGIYRHATNALSLQIFKDGDSLKFSINGQQSQEHTLSHYHYDSFIFLPTADDRVRRGLFHYSTNAWLIHFERDSEKKCNRLVWNIDAQAPKGEEFIKVWGDVEKERN